MISASRIEDAWERALASDVRYGASPTTAMMHIAIQERLDGRTVERLEQVSDEQYQD